MGASTWTRVQNFIPRRTHEFFSFKIIIGCPAAILLVFGLSLLAFTMVLYNLLEVLIILVGCVGDRKKERTQKRGWRGGRSRRMGAGTSSRAGSDSEAGERAAAAGSSRRGQKHQAGLGGALALGWRRKE